VGPAPQGPHVPPGGGVVTDWSDLRRELGVEEAFPADVLAEAESAAPTGDHEDRTDLPFLTIDPAGSMDLDQAMHLERRPGGFRVHYAIADVAAFVRPAGAVDRESRRRGATLYAPDARVPMLPPVLSEGKASLLPDQVRPAVVWSVDLHDDGTTASFTVGRALVRSRRRLTYDEVTVDDPAIALLRDIGTVLEARAAERGAVSLPSLEQEVVLDGEGGDPCLQFRVPAPSEGWNEQISLLAGRCAAALMLDGGVGLLRTLPPPDETDVASLRRSALALGLPWPEDQPYAEVVAALDPHDGRAAALLTLVPRLLRGAGYVAFDAGTPPAQRTHSAVAAPYAHCTAPLRRLGDRFVNEVCLALCAGTEVPAWVRAALPELPELLVGADRRARALDRAALDLAEALVLEPCVGRVFEAVVVDHEVVQLTAPAVRAPCDGATELGIAVRARLLVADPATRKVRFELAE
jgi:exoribonuclease R